MIKKKLNRKIFYSLPILFMVFSILLSPTILFAEENPLPGGIIPCTNNCGWSDFIKLIQNVITFVLYIAIPITVAMFTYAGVLYLTAAGKTGQIEKAHTIFLNVLIGFIIVLSAWLIVNTIANALLDKTNFNSFLQETNSQ